MRRLHSRRWPLPLLGTWAVLAVPSVPLSAHQCHGAVGLLAHSPFYAFVLVGAVLSVVGVAELFSTSADDWPSGVPEAGR